MKIGTYYYPEQWPREQWERDFDHITYLGLQIVHMAEFAWFELEPSPGKFQFEWLHHCLELARARKLEVILCTPTAAPPIWLSQTLPQTLPVREGGQVTRFGGRRHYNPCSPEFAQATRRIVSAMAKEFGDHPSVIGWQIDNEYSGGFDQSPATHAAFGGWLRKKYGDIQALNRAWGNQFWNTYYTDFGQIQMPPTRDPGYANPHHHLDASRFWSWAFAQFNRLQTDILRPHIGSRFLTTNFMPLHLDCDPGDMAADLSLFSWDSYPVTGWEKEGDDDAYRLADPSSLGLVHDQMAAYNGRWALMEIQPGQVNWSGVPVRLFPGAVRLWLWTAFAHGAEFVTVYRFRQARFGIELFHHGLVQHDGVTLSQGGREFAQVAGEIGQLDLTAIPAIAEELIDPFRTVGLVFDFEQLWYYATLPQAKRWNQGRWWGMWYNALARLGLRVRVLLPGQEWPSDLPVVVAPGIQMMDEGLLGQIKRYAEEGSHVVLTCRTALMDRDGQAWESPIAAPIVPLIGATIEGYDGLRDGRFGHIQFQGKEFKWGVWGDQLSADADTDVVATYGDQFYAGAAAITRKKHGLGSFSYFGAYSEAALVEAFVEWLCDQIGPGRIYTTALAPRAQVYQRGKYNIALNFNDHPLTTPAPVGTEFIIGSARLGPADVAVWETKA